MSGSYQTEWATNLGISEAFYLRRICLIKMLGDGGIYCDWVELLPQRVVRNHGAQRQQ